MALPNLNRIRRINATLPPLQRDHTVPWQQVAGFRHLLISRLHLILPQKLGRASTERERESKEEEERREKERQRASKQASRPRQADHGRPQAGQKQARAHALPVHQTRPDHFIPHSSSSHLFRLPSAYPLLFLFRSIFGYYYRRPTPRARSFPTVFLILAPSQRKRAAQLPPVGDR